MEPSFLDIVRGISPELADEIEARNGVEDVCKTPGCPAHVKYDEIEYEGTDGVMFVCGNLLVWRPMAELEFDRDEQTFEMCRGEAVGRQLI